MSRLKIKFIVVFILFIVSVILFLFRPVENEKERIIKSVKTGEEIKNSLLSEIDSVLFLFGIKKDWIKNSAGKSSAEWFTKEIYLSYDIYAGAVLSDLNRYLLKYDLRGYSKEDFNPNPLVPVNLYTQIKDISVQPEVTVAGLGFLYKDGLKRDAGEICIVLDKFENFEREKAVEIINNQSYFSFVMPNVFEAIDIQALMIDSKSNYINCFELGEADNYQADFREQNDNRRNRGDNIRKIHQICNEYDKEKALVLLNPLKINETQSEIIKGLSKCRGNLFLDTLLLKIDLNNEKYGSELGFDKLIKENTGNGSISKAVLLSINGEDYSKLIEAVSGMEKAGFRFYYFNDFIGRKFPGK